MSRVFKTHALLKSQPGYLQDIVLEQAAQNGDFNILTVVEWDSQASVVNARAAIASQYEQMKFNPQEMFARLGIKADLGNYQRIDVRKEGVSMIKISILYPSGGRFDMGYYLNTHMPRSIELLSKGKGYRGVSVERGLGGASPGSAPAHVAMCHYQFDTVDDFMAAFMPHAAELQGDMPNYTDIEPVIQFSEVAISR